MDQNHPPGSAIFQNLIYVLHPFQEIAPGEGGSQGLSGNFHYFFNHSLSRSVLIYLGSLPSMFAIFKLFWSPVCWCSVGNTGRP